MQLKESLSTHHIQSLNGTINKYTTSDMRKIWISGDNQIFVDMVDLTAQA